MTHRLAGLALFFLAWALACARGTPAAADLPTADALIQPYVPVHFGEPIEATRKALPGLVASGWQEGTRATWIDPGREAGLEVETDGGRVRAVALTFGPERAQVVEADVGSRLGPGVACAALPEGVSSFRPTLWRSGDGAAVSLVRKQRIVEFSVERPATRAFEEAWASCGR